MPPRIRFDRQDIIKAAFDIVREEGEDKLNVRNVAKRLGCSTQPVMSHFSSVEELRAEASAAAEEFHADYLSQVGGPVRDILIDLGIRYIRFAYEEKNLFRFIFLSDDTSGSIISDMMDEKDQSPVIDLMRITMRLDNKSSREAFIILFTLVHGYAVIAAQNSAAFDEDMIRRQLKLSMLGIRDRLLQDQDH